ncbi:ABC transporter permease [Microcella alkalica]|uniref:Peptide/nickel transport system permease protein n=1 Tax=Microcella alkalica TaxID=355930 RepID=A0A839ECS5_9MICO|nr:ABC transporter permease [Microcella alkalica]MBA8848252.1 peptide/nickel transport system permease protein [Microcella alkalica]
MTALASPRISLPTDPNHRTAAGVRWERRLQLAREVLRNPLTVFGLVIIGFFLLMAAAAPLLTEQNQPDAYQAPRDWSNIDVPPGTDGHVLGTDSTGGDVLYGIIWGSRLSLQLSFTVVFTTLVIGTIVGSIAAMRGGRVDNVLMRIVDIFLAIPELIFALAIAAVLGPSFENIILALASVFWVKYARIVRGEIIRVKQSEYVAAARVVGDSTWNIYRKDVLPNSLTPLMVQATLDMGNVVLIGATLSYLGLAQAGLTEWGAMVSAGQSGLLAGEWWVSTFAGLAIVLWALAFNLVGDGLRDVLDPKMEGR